MEDANLDLVCVDLEGDLLCKLLEGRTSRFMDIMQLLERRVPCHSQETMNSTTLVLYFWSKMLCGRCVG